MKRQEANIAICAKLLEWFLKPENKDQRFQQGLFNLGITEQESTTLDGNQIFLKDKYNEESIITLNKLQ